VTSKSAEGIDHKVSKDAALIIELLLKIFEFNYSHYAGMFAGSALRSGLVQYCLDGILGGCCCGVVVFCVMVWCATVWCVMVWCVMVWCVMGVMVWCVMCDV
jgi:hypothetical protein